MAFILKISLGHRIKSVLLEILPLWEIFYKTLSKPENFAKLIYLNWQSPTIYFVSHWWETPGEELVYNERATSAVVLSLHSVYYQ